MYLKCEKTCAIHTKHYSFEELFNNHLSALTKWRLVELGKKIHEERRSRFNDRNGPRVEMVERGFNETEFRLFMSVVDDRYDRICFTLMAALGLRIGEVLRIQGKHIKEGKLTILSEKGSFEACLTLPENILSMLPNLADEEKLIPIVSKNIRVHLYEYLKRVGLDEIYLITRPGGAGRVPSRRYRLSLHSFRRYAIQKFYRLTKDVDLTRRFARHRQVQNTETYLKTSRREEVELVLEKMVIQDPPMQVVANNNSHNSNNSQSRCQYD